MWMERVVSHDGIVAKGSILAIHNFLPDPSSPVTNRVTNRYQYVTHVYTIGIHVQDTQDYTWLHREIQKGYHLHWTGKVSVNSLVEGICAIHLASYVSAPYKDRGGLMLVGPPGVLKTTLLDVLDENYHNALSVSNAFMQTMGKLQSAFYNGQVRSLCFPDLQSVYAGDPRTSGRIEQMMMQLSGEATRTVSGGQDSRYSKFKGYCTIFACMTETFHQARADRWDGIGFLRRFLWSTYTLADPEVLIRAIMEWTRADLGSYRIPEIPTNVFIKESLTAEERKEIFHILFLSRQLLLKQYKQNDFTEENPDKGQRCCFVFPGNPIIHDG